MMRTLLVFFLLLFFKIFATAQSSNFEIKVAINPNDCIKCSNYLYGLNSLSKKYKISFILNEETKEDSVYAIELILGSKIKNFNLLISDSLHKKYSYQTHNYVTALKNKEVILITELEKIKTQIDYLNELSFEAGDTILLNYNVGKNNGTKIIFNNLYIHNKTNNILFSTNLINGKTINYDFNYKLIDTIFKINFNGSTEKLTEIKNYYQSANATYNLEIGGFDVNENKLYILVFGYYIDEILYKNIDTILGRIIVLLEYNIGNEKPIIYPLSLKLKNSDYDFSHYNLAVIDKKAFINVMLKNQKKYNEKSYWMCKCELNENIFLDTTDCIPRPKLHVELKLAHNFSEYRLDGDYLINTITNELINYKTKTSTELKIHFNKIIPDKNSPFKDAMNYSLIDFKTSKNITQIIYFMDSAYHYLSYDLKNDKVIENFPIVTNYLEVLKAAPKLFSKNLFYIFPKNKNIMVLKEIKPIN